MLRDFIGKGIKEVVYFDIYFEDDYFFGGGNVIFIGIWSYYLFLFSGFIVINIMDCGVFVVKKFKGVVW